MKEEPRLGVADERVGIDDLAASGAFFAVTLVRIDLIKPGPNPRNRVIEKIQSIVKTVLEHASGVIIRLARWTSQQGNDELRVDERNGRNAVCFASTSAAGRSPD